MDVPKATDPSLSHFAHSQMQMAFWHQAQALGAHARIEAHLGVAGRADLLIARDLLMAEPLAVVEFKEQLGGCSSIYGGMAQVRRYQKWIAKRTGITPAAYLVTGWIAPEVANDFRWRDGDRGVTVLDATGLSLALRKLLRRKAA